MKNYHLHQAIAFLGALGGTAMVHAASTLQFSATSYTVAENAGNVALTVQRIGDLDTVVSVDCVTVTTGTATVGADYLAVSTNLTFLVGETNKTVRVPILNDALIENVETFQVALSNATGGAVLGAPANANVYITDNDRGLAFEFANYRAIENEPYVLIGVTRGDDGDFPIAVDVRTTDVTALAGQDYSGLTNTLSFAPGDRLKLLSVPIHNDGVKEANETFRLTLLNPAGGGVLGSPTVATVTLVDNDPGVQFTYPWSGEYASVAYGGHEYDGKVEIVVTRGNDGLLEPFTVRYAARDLTATNGLDYFLSDGILEFAAGQCTRLLSIPLANDGLAEADERFQVVLSNPTGGMELGRFTNVTVTIWDSTGWTPHGLAGIRSLGADTMELTLAGAVPTRFRPFLDLYLLEASSELCNWEPWSYAVRTNATAAASRLAFTTCGEAQRFFRTRTDMLITPRPPPTGPYAVGKLNRWVTDPTRRNRYNVSTNSSMWMTAWYPAVQPAAQSPTPYFEEQLVCTAADTASWKDRLIAMNRFSYLNAPALPGSDKFPVVVHSHGAGALRMDSEDKAEELASHGYVVVATDHFDVLGLTFPDGSYHVPSLYTGTTGAGLQDRVQDMRFLLDQLEAWNQDDPVLAGRLDLSRMAAMGFSWGGDTAAEVCRVDPRFRAAVLFDSGTATPTVPSLSVNRSDRSDQGVFVVAPPGSVWLQISSTEHLHFHDLGFFLLGLSLPDVWEVARTYNAYVLAFLNWHLKGEQAKLPLTGYPRAINVRVK